LLDSAVFPGMQGGPLMHVIAAKAVSFGEALDESFGDYSRRVIVNASAMADAFVDRGYNVVSGGTDNHLMLIDLRSKGVTGKHAETILEQAGITVNKNMVPFDDQSPFVTSGMRIGTPAMTTRGFGVEEFEVVVEMIDRVLTSTDAEATAAAVHQEVRELCQRFPLYDFVLP
jgi:glycine hydroxymethyltransferase